MPLIPFGEDRRATAILLVGTAEEYGIAASEIKVRPQGFEIPDELADVLYDESANKASGNRAAKKNSKKERA